MHKEAALKLTKARSALIIDHPFFGSLALRLRLIEESNMSTACGPMTTMAVDGKHIYYHPDFVMKLSMKHLQFVVAHEVMHCVWHHMTRLGPRDPAKWNHAGDYVINAMLKGLKDAKGKEMFEMPPIGLYKKEFDGPEWTADKVYNHLPDPPKGGGPKPGESGGSFDHVLPSDPNAPPQDASERAQSEREWRVATITAANQAKMSGKLPASLERFLEDLYKPQIDWAQKLREFVSETTRNDYDWMRPNKRFEHVYLPSLHDESVGEIVVVIDDSGSIGAKTLAIFGAEIKAIMEDCRPAVTHLIYCDAQVSAHYELKADETPVFKCHGGGGTDFGPPFELIKEKNIEPKCLIYLTDLMGPHGPEPYYPVMWICITDLKAPWGETVPIKDYDAEAK